MLLFFVSGICYYVEPFKTIVKDFPVDIVYTWVNTYDPQWIRQYKKYVDKDFDSSSARWSRTKNPWAEINLSLESVRKYMPWIRNIYIVTHRPQRLPQELINKYSVRIVHHDEIFHENSSLPTFSSRSIEAFLVNIPGLSENFIYSNDDNYVCKPMLKSDFFVDGKPLVRYRRNFSEKVRSREVYPQNEHTFIELKHNILSEKNGMLFYSPIHQMLPMTKSVIKSTIDIFYDNWVCTGKNRTRQNTDIIPFYLSVIVGVNKGMIILKENDASREGFFEVLEDLKPFDYDFLCINSIKPEEMEELRNFVLKK